jgi:endonuclease III
MDIQKLEEIIHPYGFYKNKANNIRKTAEIIVNKYKGLLNTFIF